MLVEEHGRPLMFAEEEWAEAETSLQERDGRRHDARENFEKNKEDSGSKAWFFLMDR